MKFSEMTTRQQAKIVCGIAAPVSRIAKDEQLNAMLGDFAKDKTAQAEAQGGAQGKTVLQIICQVLEPAIPLLLDRHYDDTMAIAAALTDKPVSELETMGIFGIVREVRGVLDGELIGFFKQSGSSEAGK